MLLLQKSWVGFPSTHTVTHNQSFITQFWGIQHPLPTFEEPRHCTCCTCVETGQTLTHVKITHLKKTHRVRVHTRCHYWAVSDREPQEEDVFNIWDSEAQSQKTTKMTDQTALSSFLREEVKPGEVARAAPRPTQSGTPCKFAPTSQVLQCCFPTLLVTEFNRHIRPGPWIHDPPPSSRC